MNNKILQTIMSFFAMIALILISPIFVFAQESSAGQTSSSDSNTSPVSSDSQNTDSQGNDQSSSHTNTTSDSKNSNMNTASTHSPAINNAVELNNTRISSTQQEINKLEAEKSMTTNSETQKTIEAQIMQKMAEKSQLENTNSALREATNISEGSAELIASTNNGGLRDVNSEALNNYKYTKKIVGTSADVSLSDRVNNFITYGTPSTVKLGEGERAGVINSYKTAFSKVPSSTIEWSDAIKIANGHWPSETSKQAITDASSTFEKIYHRTPNIIDQHDNAAVTIMAYGLRPIARNIESETVALATFKNIFHRNPLSAKDWDSVRAIAYSGATR